MQKNGHGVVDRFEGRFAFIETGSGIIRIPKEKLPAGVREGTHIIICGRNIAVDADATSAAQKKAAALLKGLK